MSEQLYIDLYTNNQDELQDWLSTQKHDGKWQESYHTKSYAISAWETSHDQTVIEFKGSLDHITSEVWKNKHLNYSVEYQSLLTLFNSINDIRKQFSIKEINW